MKSNYTQHILDTLKKLERSKKVHKYEGGYIQVYDLYYHLCDGDVEELPKTIGKLLESCVKSGKIETASVRLQRGGWASGYRLKQK